MRYRPSTNKFNCRYAVVVAFLTVALVGCGNDPAKLENELERSFNHAAHTEKDLVVTDTVLFQEDHQSFFDHLLFGQSLKMRDGLVFGITGPGRILAYDLEGKPVFSFDRSTYDKSYLLPEGVPIAVSYYREHFYFLMPYDNRLFKIDKEMTMLEEVKLDLPDDRWFIANPALYVTEKGVYVATGYKDYTSGKDFYSKSDLMSIFDLGGNFIKGFGAYPEYYTEGEYFYSTSKRFQVIMEDNEFYVLHNHSPEISVFDASGNLVRSFGQMSQFMDKRFKSYSKEAKYRSELAKKVKNDFYYFFGKEQGHDIFYYGFNIQSSRTWSGPIGTSFMVAYDVEKNSYSEIKLPTRTYGILPKVLNFNKNEELNLVVGDKNVDEKYLLKARFTNTE